ncbi:MAG TPA: prepilin-type N-terminal cleavage/methylation domain-containing protein, partial [Firmicutes bacterium]|nr:prepilin-type N-terminal cleavage/methylation domain-containing protein [Bacillota bacterium]
MKKAGKEKGFTLVEVVAVCAIIAVLASVVMASVSGVFPRSRQEVWRSSMKGLQAACDIFYAYWGVFPTYEGSVPSLQPCSGRPAVPLNWEARGGDGRRFRDYLRSLPPARAVEVGLTPPQQTLHYGVTGKGRVIATLVSPPWGPDTPVYVLEGLAPGTWATQPLASVVGSDGAGSTPLGGSGDDADFAAGEGEWPLEEALGVVVRDGDLVPETGPGWEDTSSLPVAVGGTAGVAWGDYLYFFGGQGHATGIQRLHVPSGEWEVQENVLPGPLSGAAAVNLQGKIYLLGGSAQEGLGDRVWRYDPPTGEWQALGCSLPGKVQWAGAAAAGDNIFLFGGTVNGLGTTGIVKVNPHTEEVSSVACSLPWPVSGITAVSWGEDIYLFGGSAQFSGFTGVISQILRFDPDTETLKDTGARTPTGAGQMAVAARADGIYVFGGVRGDYRSLEPVDMVCHFHPPSGVVRAFSPALSLSPPRWGAVAIPYEDKIYVAGGWVRRDQVVSALGCLGWRQGLPQPRQALPIPSSFVALVSGRAHDLFALGGMLGTGRREVWRLVPDEGRCDAAPGMATGLANVAAVRIGNRLYTFGGVTGWTAYDGRTAQVG